MNFTIKQSNNLSEFQNICLKKQIPFVSYRLPNTEDIINLAQTKSTPKELANLEDINNINGFVISPFSDKFKRILLEPDLKFTNNDISKVQLNDISNFKTEQQIDNYNFQVSTTSKQEFEKNVEIAVSNLKSASDLKKVVLSKTLLIETPENFNAATFFQLLCKKYPHAFVYLLQINKVGCWIGATPEPLLTGNSKTFKTVSLAGTQAANGSNIEDYKWEQKEIEEQQIVTRFIENTLIEAGITNYSKTETTNYQAANLIHLMSAFEFPISREHKLSNLVGALHPTPSVGGLPKKEAEKFILEHEKHDRSYYTGFLGNINATGDTQLFVNLRCMQLINNKALLFSGAGITSDSIPEKEWIETENKLQTLKQVIFSSEL